MKKLILIIFMLPLFAAAQDTIKIPTPVAKQIVKDLVSGDSAKAELKLSNETISLLNQKLYLKDNTISAYERKGIMYEERIINGDIKFNTQALYVKELEGVNKSNKIKLRLTRVVGTVIMGTLTYLYITK